MKALLYHGSGVKVWKDVAEPKLQAIVDVGTTAICGTDLHNLNGDLQTMVDGRIIGHEAVGTVSQVGGGVENPKVGDRVLVSFVSACGHGGSAERAAMASGLVAGDEPWPT